MNSEINVKLEIDKTTVRLLAILAALIVIMFVGARVTRAQEVAETVRINTRVVFMDALVKDKRTGMPIADLKPENFEIYDDGNLRPVSYFTREGEARKPLALVLILDLRDDGAGRFLKRPEVLKAMADELAKLPPGDEVAILAINVNDDDTTSTSGSQVSRATVRNWSRPWNARHSLLTSIRMLTAIWKLTATTAANTYNTIGFK